MPRSHESTPFPPPDADQRAHSERLVEVIRREIEARAGWIPFDRYMELALYAPGLGYYTAGARKFGDSATGGDFVTGPEISPLFAQALAAQLEEIFEQVPARLLEFGAGSGAPARDVAQALAARGVTLERYSIVEVTADLARRQQALLAAPAFEWLAAPPTDFEGVMIANEVLDVMPVRLFVKRTGAVHERGIAWRDDRLAWSDRPATVDLIDAVARIEHELEIEFPEGYASELAFAAPAWMREVGRWLKRGVLLAIDYGFPRREYYHPQRLMGTLMCHYRHRAHADPLWMPGLNDVTAHVDFTAAADSAHEVGLDVLGYTSQAHFLLNCGMLDLLKAEAGHRRVNEANRLLSEAEMGELFKVLAVGRGVIGPLRGFARGDRLHTL